MSDKVLCANCNLREGTIEVAIIDESTKKLTGVHLCKECDDARRNQAYDEYPTKCEECTYEMGEAYNDLKGDVNTYVCHDALGEFIGDKRLCDDCFNKLNGYDGITRVRKY